MDLSNLKYDETVQETKDTVGSSYAVKPSGVYPATVKVAYFEKSSKGALGLNLTFGLEDGSEYKETLYVTSGNDKGNKPYYTNKDGEKVYLPGFLNADAIALLITGKPLSECATERKVVKIYNYDQKQEVPTEVDCVTALHGQQVQLGIIQEKSYKSEKQQDGTYKETDETRETNQIDKVFHKDTGKTVNEYRAKVEQADFKAKWLERWNGKVKDKTTGKSPSGAVTGAPKAAQAKPASSLFA